MTNQAQLADFLQKFLDQPNAEFISFMAYNFNITKDSQMKAEDFAEMVKDVYLPAAKQTGNEEAQRLADNQDDILSNLRCVAEGAELVRQYCALARPKDEAAYELATRRDDGHVKAVRVNDIRALQHNLLRIARTKFADLDRNETVFTDTYLKTFVASCWYAAMPARSASDEEKQQYNAAKKENEIYGRQLAFYSKSNPAYFEKEALSAQCFRRGLRDIEDLPTDNAIFDERLQKQFERKIGRHIWREFDHSKAKFKHHREFTDALKAILCDNHIYPEGESLRFFEIFIDRYHDQFEFKKVLRLFDPVHIPNTIENNNVNCLIRAFIHSNAVKFKNRATKRRFLKLIDELCADDADILQEDNSQRRVELIDRVLKLVKDERNEKDTRYFMVSSIFFMLQKQGKNKAIQSLLRQDDICAHTPQNIITNLSVYDKSFAKTVCDTSRFYKARFLSPNQMNRIILSNPELLNDNDGIFTRVSSWFRRLKYVTWFTPKTFNLGDDLELFRVFDSKINNRRILSKALDKNPVALKAFLNSTTFQRASIEQKARFYLEATKDGQIRRQMRYTKRFGFLRRENHAFFNAVLRCKDKTLVAKLYASFLDERPGGLSRYLAEINETFDALGSVKLADSLKLSRSGMPNRDLYLAELTRNIIRRFMGGFPGSWKADDVQQFRDLLTKMRSKPTEITRPMVQTLFVSPQVLIWMAGEDQLSELLSSQAYIDEHQAAPVINKCFEQYVSSLRFTQVTQGFEAASGSPGVAFIASLLKTITAETVRAWMPRGKSDLTKVFILQHLGALSGDALEALYETDKELRDSIIQRSDLLNKMSATFLLKQYSKNPNMRQALDRNIMQHGCLMAEINDNVSFFHEVLTCDGNELTFLARAALKSKSAARAHVMKYAEPENPQFSQLMWHKKRVDILHELIAHQDYDMTLRLLKFSPSIRDLVVQDKSIHSFLLNQSTDGSPGLRQAVIEALTFEEIEQVSDSEVRDLLKSTLYCALSADGTYPCPLTSSTRDYFIDDKERYKQDFLSYRQTLQSVSAPVETDTTLNIGGHIFGRGRSGSKPAPAPSFLKSSSFALTETGQAQTPAEELSVLVS